MKYRIETVSIPAYTGVARTPYPSADLEGRRIVHVFGDADSGPRGDLGDSMRLVVLTEIIEEETPIARV